MFKNKTEQGHEIKEMSPEDRRRAMRVMSSTKIEDMKVFCSTCLFAVGDIDVDVKD